MIKSKKNNTFHCQNCNSHKSTVLHTVKDSQNNVYSLIQCQDCALIITYPKPVLKVLYKTYYQSYRSAINGQRFPFMLDFLMKIWRNLRASRMAHLSHMDPILDVGCGQAIELQILKKRDIKVYGLEYDRSYAATIQAQTKIKVYEGKLMTVPKIRGGFGLISFLHSLEHVPEALTDLKIAHTLLRKSGYLMISLPNFASLESQYFGSSWFHLDIPRHLYHFTQNWLIEYVTSLGFRLTWKKHVAPEYDFYSLLQSSLNKLFPERPNLLYHILLREQKKSFEDYTKLIPQLPFIVILSLLTLVFTPLFWLIGGNGTMELVFQKQK